MHSVNPKDVISGAAIFISTIIAVTGWMISARKDRIDHLFQKRLEKRMAMLEDVVTAIVPLRNYTDPFEADTELPSKLGKARLSVQIYGYDDELMQYESLVKALERKDVCEAIKSSDAMALLTRNHIRKELGYKS
jgi:hypothetical protein